MIPPDQLDTTWFVIDFVSLFYADSKSTVKPIQTANGSARVIHLPQWCVPRTTSTPFRSKYSAISVMMGHSFFMVVFVSFLCATAQMHHINRFIRQAVQLFTQASVFC